MRPAQIVGFEAGSLFGAGVTWSDAPVAEDLCRCPTRTLKPSIATSRLPSAGGALAAAAACSHRAADVQAVQVQTLHTAIVAGIDFANVDAAA